MTGRRVGLWLVGAFGGVGTTTTLGLAAMARGLVDQTGLVTALPELAGLPLPAPADFVIGGHEIRKTSFAESAQEFRRSSGVFDSTWLAACHVELAAATARVRPGPRLGLSPVVARLANWDESRPAQTPRQAIDQIAADLDAFRTSEAIDHLIVMNVASTEPPFPLGPVHQRWEMLEKALAGEGGSELLPSSTLYAIAALEGGHSYVNFTPSLGASLPALAELAGSTGSLLAGKDGKTGETLMKTVLAPMLHRNLRVQSWVGHNIFGNRDGQVLDDPLNKTSKVETKDRVITQILGYRPTSLVTIEYIPDMGDWKTAWDHIHFQGFMGTQMTLQFTWQGCDSLLAAPLVIDLARLTDAEKVRGGKGLMRHLASFFKSPEGVDQNDFFRQFDDLLRYATQAKGA